MHVLTLLILCVLYTVPNIPSTWLILAFILIKVFNPLTSSRASAQTLSGAGCAPRGHCLTLRWSCSSFLINGLMYGFGAKAKAYGNQLLLLPWNEGNESQCSRAIQRTPLPWPSSWTCHSGHCHKPKQEHVNMHTCVQTDRLIYSFIQAYQTCNAYYWKIRAF